MSEWEVPVKRKDEYRGGTEWFCGTTGVPYYGAILDSDGYIGDDNDPVARIPKDIALRLLAAEASDRLGWVWATEWLDTKPERVALVKCHAGSWDYQHPPVFEAAPPDASSCLLDPDELLAIHHGRFLLEDAMKGA